MSTHQGMWQADPIQPARHRPELRIPRPPRISRRIVAIVLAVLVVAGMAAYAYSRIRAGVEAIASSGMPSWAWPFLAGLAIGLGISFRAGQYHRGWMHARGIRKSHWSAIRGAKH